MANALTITVRSFVPGDEESIMQGFNSAFGLNRNSDYWRWKFLHKNTAIASIAVDEKQTVQAHIAAYPVTWHCNKKQLFVPHAGDAFSLQHAKAIHGRALLKTLTRLHKDQRSKGESATSFPFSKHKLETRYTIRQSPFAQRNRK